MTVLSTFQRNWTLTPSNDKDLTVYRIPYFDEICLGAMSNWFETPAPLKQASSVLIAEKSTQNCKELTVQITLRFTAGECVILMQRAQEDTGMNSTVFHGKKTSDQDCFAFKGSTNLKPRCRFDVETKDERLK